MQTTRGNRGAWRRATALPRAFGPERGATIAAPSDWAEAAPHRAPDRIGATGLAEAGPLDADQRVRHGGCLCGAVRYEVRGAPTVVGLCHCADCRKATGGFAMPYGDWPAEAFQVTGRLAAHAGRSFCPDCGSRVVHLSPGQAEVILGTLDDPPSDLRPQREIWTIRRESWMPPVPGAEQFERDAS